MRHLFFSPERRMCPCRWAGRPAPYNCVSISLFLYRLIAKMLPHSCYVKMGASSCIVKPFCGRFWVVFLCGAVVQGQSPSPPERFNGLDMNLGNLSRLSNAQSRSISPENFTGEKGKAGMATEGTGKGPARELGQGWKVSPSVRVEARSTFTMAEIDGSGRDPADLDDASAASTKPACSSCDSIGTAKRSRRSKCPLGDFFACGWAKYCQINSLPVCVNPGSAFNCYWQMPFRKKAKITLENLGDNGHDALLSDQLHAHGRARRRGVFSRPIPPLESSLPGEGSATRFSTACAAGGNTSAPIWPGKSIVPAGGARARSSSSSTATRSFPPSAAPAPRTISAARTISRIQQTHRYQTFSTPYSGLAQVLPPDQIYMPLQRFGLYRWHIADPVRFKTDMKVTIQALGWKTLGRYLPLEDDIASVAYWYQTEPHAKFPPLPPRERLLIKPVEEIQRADEEEAAAKLKKQCLLGADPQDKHITSVNFAGHAIDDDALLLVGKLYSLTTFDASGTKINDDQLDYIAWMPTLHTLNLSKTKVTDAGLEKLASLDNLQWLVLSDTDVSDVGIDHLAGVKTLARLTIDGTKVTPAGIARLKKALPKLVVEGGKESEVK